MIAHLHFEGEDQKLEKPVSRVIVHTPFGTVIIQEYSTCVDVLATHAKSASLNYVPPDDNKGQTATITLK